MKIDNTVTQLLKNDSRTTAELGSRAQTAAAENLTRKPDQKSYSGDVVQLSSNSRLASRSLELAKGAPDVRQDKIDDIKTRLSSGTYSVSGQAVAESMIRKSITEV